MKGQVAMKQEIKQLFSDLMNPKPSELASESWFQLIPELKHLEGLVQNRRYHHHDVWTHTLLVVDAIEPELDLRITALLHDMGKGMPGVRVLNKYGEFSDYSHDKVGAKMAREVLQRFELSPERIRRITWLIQHHLQFPIPVEKSVHKWLKRIYKQSEGWASAEEFGEALEDLLKLRRADRIGGHIEPDLSEWQQIANLARADWRDVIK